MREKVNLKEYLYPEMDILFVALNAPDVSNKNEHWFSYNLSFWNVLYKSGLITEPIFDKIKGDEKVFGSNAINFQNQIFGVTDLNRGIVQTDSSNIKTTTAQVKRILKIIDKHKVHKLCLMHSKVAIQFEKEWLIVRGEYGKVGKYKDVPIYEVPFHNASKKDKHKYYNLLIK